MTGPERVPCDRCRRMHPAPACPPDGPPSSSRTITLPAWLADRLDELVPWGERSGYIARALADRLELDLAEVDR